MEAKLYVLKVLANLRLTRGLESKLFSWRAGQPDHSAPGSSSQSVHSTHGWINMWLSNHPSKSLSPNPKGSPHRRSLSLFRCKARPPGSAIATTTASPPWWPLSSSAMSSRSASRSSSACSPTAKFAWRCVNFPYPNSPLPTQRQESPCSAQLCSQFSHRRKSLLKELKGDNRLKLFWVNSRESLELEGPSIRSDFVT